MSVVGSNDQNVIERNSSDLALLVDPGLPAKQVLVAALRLQRDDVAVAAPLRFAAEQLRVVIGGRDGAVAPILAGCGLLSSVRGAGGGFALARPAGTISLADIVEAVEGPIAMAACSNGKFDCALDAHCRVKPHMGVVGNAVRGALGAVSLTKLAR